MPRGKTKKKYFKSKNTNEINDDLHEHEYEVELDEDDYIVQLTEAFMYPFNMISSMLSDDNDNEQNKDLDENVEEKSESKKKRGRPKTRRTYNKN